MKSFAKALVALILLGVVSSAAFAQGVQPPPPPQPATAPSDSPPVAPALSPSESPAPRPAVAPSESLPQRPAFAPSDSARPLVSGSPASRPVGPAAVATKPSFLMLDRNRDGRITRSEAAAAPDLAKDFDRYDLNRDGSLDRVEFDLYSK